MPDEMISASAISFRDAIGKIFTEKYNAYTKCSDINRDKIPLEVNIPDSDNEKKHENWKVRSKNGYMEELFVRDRCVVWSRFSEKLSIHPLISLTMDSPVVSACWSSFILSKKYADDFEVNPPSNSSFIQSGICIFESQRCTFVEDRGASHLCRLPFRVENAWPLSTSILLERRPTIAEKTKTEYQTKFRTGLSFLSASPCFSPFTTQKDSVADALSLFTLFLMSHPLDEMTPILMKIPHSSGGPAKLCFANDINQRVVGVVDSLGLVIIFNIKLGTHSVWQLEKARTEDYAHLYFVGDDGRITVAPEALADGTAAVVLESALANASHTVSRPLLSTPVDTNSSVTSPLKFGTVMSTADQTPTLATMTSLRNHIGPSLLCLSPFRASLQRLKRSSNFANETSVHLPQQSLLRSVVDAPGNTTCTPIYDLTVGPPSPNVDLDEHIRRLSAVSFVPPIAKNNSNCVSGLEEGYTYQSFAYPTQSPFSTDTKSFNRRRSSQRLITKPRSRHNSRTLGYSSIPGVFATASHPPPDVNPFENQTDCHETIDEPLLPKVCLRLLWNEISSDPATAGITDFNLPKTPKLHFARGTHMTGGDVLVNPRIIELAQHTPPPNKTHIDMKNYSTEEVDDPHEGPSRCRAFLAEDMVGTRWVCFLKHASVRRFGDGSQVSNQLACLRILENATQVVEPVELEDTTEVKKSSFVSLENPIFLKAVDAVYVPASHLTVCLEANRAVTIYSGVVKVLLLGTLPPPTVFAASCLSNNPSELMPSLVRPSTSEVVASAVETKIAQLVSVFPSSSTFSQTKLHFNLTTNTSDGCYNQPKLNKVMPLPCQPEVTGIAHKELWRLCLPVNHQFTLALISQSGIDQPGLSLPSRCRKQVHIRLPNLSTDNLVQRCLSGLRQGLPKEVALELLVRWFNHRNPPGGSQAITSLFSSGSWGALITEENEMLAFAHFLLLLVGLVPYEEESDMFLVTMKYQSSSSLNHQGPRTPGDDRLNKRYRVRSGSRTLDKNELRSAEKKLFQRLTVPEALIDLRLRDPARWRVIQHLPGILFTLHMVYENEKLDLLLAQRLKFLAIINNVLARYLRLAAFCEYYVSDGFSGPSQTELVSLPRISRELIPLLIWPPSVSITEAPCLYRWSTSLLTGPALALQVPYFHVPGVNDFATAIASLLLSFACHLRGFKSLETNAFGEAVAVWSQHIRTPETSKDTEMGNVVGPTLSREVHQASVNPILLAFATAFVYISEHNSVSASRLAYQQCVLFINELGVHAPLCQQRLTELPSPLPPALASILQVILNGCTSNPPSNCSSDVYEFIGREDLSRQFDIMRFSGESVGHESMAPQILCGASKKLQKPPESAHVDCWSPAERWANLVRPLRLSPSSSLNSVCRNRHFLLTSLENNPACQVTFPKDLRIQEAYRLLQTSSHIWLPRVCTDELVFGPLLFAGSDVQHPGGGNGGGGGPSNSAILTGIAKARLDMHLAAACVRTSALPLGKGMLGLGILHGALHLPSRLPILPICLRGRTMAASSSLPMHHDLARGSLLTEATTVAAATGGPAALRSGGVGDALAGAGGLATDQASDHAGNPTALAIITAVIANGTAASIRNACSLSRLLQPKERSVPVVGIGPADPEQPLSLPAMRHLAAIASNAALAAASAVSSTSILYTPNVLASRHWPDFHSGVAAGLMISPHATIDTAWIIQNSRAIAASSSSSGATTSSLSGAAGTKAVYSPTQAGFLLGLGLNGHLNKLSAHYIRELTVNVHDLTNTAVILGLCAGKRGTMDQAILRLLAIHYRPLLTPDPVLVDVSVPNLCQAAASFGLGLLFQGSAHRQMAGILLAELGRPLGGGGAGFCASSAERASAQSGIGTNTNDASVPDTNGGQQNGNGGTTRGNSSGGSGGFAADSRELISLSAGFALGLVMLQRGDSPCGLSDLALSQTLHAYMTGGYRDNASGVSLDLCNDMDSAHLLGDSSSMISVPRPPVSHPLPDFLQPHLLSLRGCRPGLMMPSGLVTASARTTSGTSRDTFLSRHDDSSPSVPLDELIDLGFAPGDTPALTGRQIPAIDRNQLLTAVEPLDSFFYNDGIGVTLTESSDQATASLLGPTMTPRTSAGRPPHTSVNGERLRHPIESIRTGKGVGPGRSWNHQVREGDTYNTDVSSPGAIIALGFTYLGTGNESVSHWLRVPNTPRGLDSIRPDLLMLRTISLGLVNWNSIEASSEWIRDLIPAFLRSAISPAGDGRPLSSTSQNPDRLVIITATEDIENQSPMVAGIDDQIHVSALTGASVPSTGVVNEPTSVVVTSGITSAGGVAFGMRTQRRQPLSPKTPVPQTSTSWTRSGGTTSLFSDLSRPPSVDYGTISLAYLNIIAGAGFVLGLKFAGTCDPKATKLLHALTISFLNGSWWPPNTISPTAGGPTISGSSQLKHNVSLSTVAQPSSSAATSSTTTAAGDGSLLMPRSTNTPTYSSPPRLSELPPMETAVREASASCLLALAMVVAGSGNLTVLRIARKLRSIRLFNGDITMSDNSAALRRIRRAECINPRWPPALETYRTTCVAMASAHASANVQSMPSASPNSQPVSTASILGAVLAPDFGLQMVYGAVVGLLFLGGGRLTLCNSPEAAALLTIAFFPRFPIYAGDNWYHLQCLRHLYVLATRPRRVCAVDVATNQVVPMNMRATLKRSHLSFTSQFTAVFPSGCFDDLTSVEFNRDKSDYLPTCFYPCTQEWALLKQTVDETGYLFLKRRPASKLLEKIDSWMNTCLARWNEPATIWQLKLMSIFLHAASTRQDSKHAVLFSPQSYPTLSQTSEGFIARALMSQVTKTLWDHRTVLRSALRTFFLSNAVVDEDQMSSLIAFRIWFLLPPSSLLKPHLPKDEVVSLPALMNALRPVTHALSPSACYWLHRFMYSC